MYKFKSFKCSITSIFQPLVKICLELLKKEGCLFNLISCTKALIWLCLSDGRPATGDLDYGHMYVNDLRFVNAIFWLTLISTGVFTCIRMRSASSNTRFVSAIFSAGEQKYHIRMEICIDFHGRIWWLSTEIVGNITKRKSAVCWLIASDRLHVYIAL